MSTTSNILSLCDAYFNVARPICSSTQEIIARHGKIVSDLLNISNASWPIQIEISHEIRFPQRSEHSHIMDIPGHFVDIQTLDKLVVGALGCGEFLYICLSRISSFKSEAIINENDVKNVTSFSEYATRHGFSPSAICWPPYYYDAREELKKSFAISVSDSSCTGKTYLAMASLYGTDNCHVYCRSFSKTITDGILLSYLFFGVGVNLFFDDAQNNTDLLSIAIDYISKNIDDIKRRECRIIIAAWPHVKRYFASSNIKIIKTPTNQLSFILSSGATPPWSERWRNNVALLNAARQSISADVLNYSDQEKAIFNRFVRSTSQNLIKQVSVAAVIGAYEFECPVEFILRATNTRQLLIDEWTVQTSKIENGHIFMGHREICRFIHSYIKSNLDVSVDDEADIIFRFLNFLGKSELWPALCQIVSDDRSTVSGRLSSIWRLVKKMSQQLLSESKRDPTWGWTPSSMFFALKAASTLGVISEYKEVMQSFCSIFNVSSHGVRIDTSRLKTSHDFMKIRERMIEEDAATPCIYESGYALDCTVMHENWVIGLGICLSEEMSLFGYSSLHSALVDEALRRLLPNGAWYPSRVPWVTSRILIGLGSSGLSTNVDQVKRACDFLISAMDGGDHWEARTGGWNNAYETTSMAIDALTACGYIDNNEQAHRALSYLNNEYEKWSLPELEVDGTWTACSLIRSGAADARIYNYIENLSNKESVCFFDSLDYDNSQSCAISQTAYFIVDIGWFILKGDIPSLLRMFTERAREVPKMKVFISYSHDNDKHIKSVRKLGDRLKENGLEVLLDQYLPVGADMFSFMDEAMSSDIVIIIGTEHYLRKSSMINGGVGFEKSILSARRMGGLNNVVPVSVGEFRDTIPPVFLGNKGVRVQTLNAASINKVCKEVTKLNNSF